MVCETLKQKQIDKFDALWRDNHTDHPIHHIGQTLPDLALIEPSDWHMRSRRVVALLEEAKSGPVNSLEVELLKTAYRVMHFLGEAFEKLGSSASKSW